MKSSGGGGIPGQARSMVFANSSATRCACTLIIGKEKPVARTGDGFPNFRLRMRPARRAEGAPLARRV
jgi:hypothetical protein